MEPVLLLVTPRPTHLVNPSSTDAASIAESCLEMMDQTCTRTESISGVRIEFIRNDRTWLVTDIRAEQSAVTLTCARSVSRHGAAPAFQRHAGTLEEKTCEQRRN
jgi:hypothetical protein